MIAVKRLGSQRIAAHYRQTSKCLKSTSLLVHVQSRHLSGVPTSSSVLGEFPAEPAPATHQSDSPTATATSGPADGQVTGTKKLKKLSVAEIDEALRVSMSNIDGGGDSSVEMEGGKFVGLRRGVKDNMFRLI